MFRRALKPGKVWPGLASILLLLGLSCCARAEDLRYGFDGPDPAWKWSGSHKFSNRVIKIRDHSFSQHIKVEGRGAERVVLSNRSQRAEWVYFDLDLPPSLVIPELELSFWFRCNQPYADSMLHVVLPHQKNPEDPGRSVDFYISGKSYQKPSSWQQLSCSTDDKTIRERLRRLRSSLNQRELRTEGMYVDRVRVKVQVPPGDSEVFFDQFRMGPVVNPAEQGGKLQLASGIQPDQLGHSESRYERLVEFKLDRFKVQGEPTFLRVLPHHGESPEVLAQTLSNIIWIKDFKDTQLLELLEQYNLYATAIPPIALSEEGKVLTNQVATPVSFDEHTKRILFWNLGVRFAPDRHDSLIDWGRQVKHSDQHFSRPVAADVIGEERRISRDIDMLSVSRHPLHTTMSPRRYRDFLRQKSRLAQPGSFNWTWIQTEPSSQAIKTPGKQTYPIVVEPEQIRMQFYAALQAGFRGVGFWKTTPLDSGMPGAYERMLTITQLNLESAILEPWLATGRASNQISIFETEEEVQQKSLWNRFSSRNRKLVPEKKPDKKGPRVEGTMISSQYGKLMIAACYDDQTQFVPGLLSAKDVSVVVPGVSETAVAWLVTPTGLINLERTRVAGGVRVKLPEVNQTAAILLTSDHRQKDKLNRKISQIAALSAQVALELAKVKRDRVNETVDQLHQRGRKLRVDALFQHVDRKIAQAENSLSNNDFHATRKASDEAVRYLRNIQYAYWEEALSTNLESPVSSPYTISFSTLPAHWEMMARLGRGDFHPDSNLLPLGDFEADQTMELIQAGWQNYHPEVPRVMSGAQLYQNAKQGKYSLRLAAIPAVDERRPLFVKQSPVKFETPPMAVRQGQLLYVSGWIRMVQPIMASDDGFMVYDSVGGQINALRWFDSPKEWKRFSFIREVPRDQEFRVTFELTGLGEVHLDDLKVIPVDPGEAPALIEQTAPAQPETQPGRFAKPLEFFNSLPRRFNLLPRGENPEK